MKKAKDNPNNIDVPEKKEKTFSRCLPSVITICAFCFGLTSVKFALWNDWEFAILCIFVSAVLDALDGKMARLLGQSSQFGAELDSLSDLVCFGVAPALILFLKSLYMLEAWGWGICMFFTVCCALRLARFNVTQVSIQEQWQAKYFTGVPAPAGAILSLFPMILFFALGNYSCVNPFFVSFWILLSSILMISNLKTISSKMIVLTNQNIPITLLVISALIICLITNLWLTLSLLIIAYILSLPYGAYKYQEALEIKTQKENTSE